MANADATPDVAFPLVWQEYALTSREQARRIFQPNPLRRAWSMLFCADQRGAHWTALGDTGFVQAVRAAERTFPESSRRQPPSPSPVPPSGKALPVELTGEFPVEEFHPEWLLRGWTDERPVHGRIEVCPSSMVG